VVSGFYNGNRSSKGFGVLFAYDSDLEWGNIVQEMQSFADSNQRNVLCNAVFILKKAFFLHGDGTTAYKLNPHIEQLPAIKIHGYPDRETSCLYQFTASLLLMLRMTEASLSNIDQYFRLPFVAGQRSYEFSVVGHPATFKLAHYRIFDRHVHERVRVRHGGAIGDADQRCAGAFDFLLLLRLTHRRAPGQRQVAPRVRIGVCWAASQRGL
jgi:hypothetical protein